MMTSNERIRKALTRFDSIAERADADPSAIRRCRRTVAKMAALSLYDVDAAMDSLVAELASISLVVVNATSEPF